MTSKDCESKGCKHLSYSKYGAYCPLKRRHLDDEPLSEPCYDHYNDDDDDY